ncbi:MAG: hypothetical protein DRP65_02885 [Planctomycetota bacterium]|nr:MAG: hypothetical protein DRP65_02885 [Planctomycetota bacterium]
MPDNGCNHFEVITKSLTGDRPTDEETFSSTAVLAQRLERLKRSNPLFEKIDFSEQVEELALCEMISAIC